jgi:ssDNA-binding Zn-finger/Zn-ribbon topoisomerase 1
MAKTRKCPDCGEKMTVRKSSKGEGGKFWGCSGYPDCRTTIPYFGDGARAGIDIDVRQIMNGFVIRASKKYAEGDDDAPSEVYAKEDQLEPILKGICESQVLAMIEQIKDQVNGGFDKDEEAEEKKRPPKDDAAGDAPATGSKDVRKLLMEVKAKEPTPKKPS